MLPSQKKILELLQNKDMTVDELVQKTGFSPDGIRGRISELRKQHYDIVKTKGAYRLATSGKLPDRIISYVQTNGLDGKQLTYESLMDAFHVPQDELVDALAELYHKEKLVQFSKNIVIIIPY